MVQPVIKWGGCYQAYLFTKLAEPLSIFLNANFIKYFNKR